MMNRGQPGTLHLALSLELEKLAPQRLCLHPWLYPCLVGRGSRSCGEAQPQVGPCPGLAAPWCEAQITRRRLSLRLLSCGGEGDCRGDERGGKRGELIGGDAIGTVAQQCAEQGPPLLELEEEPAHATVKLFGAGAEEQLRQQQ